MVKKTLPVLYIGLYLSEQSRMKGGEKLGETFSKLSGLGLKPTTLRTDKCSTI